MIHRIGSRKKVPRAKTPSPNSPRERRGGTWMRRFRGASHAPSALATCVSTVFVNRSGIDETVKSSTSIAVWLVAARRRRRKAKVGGRPSRSG